VNHDTFFVFFLSFFAKSGASRTHAHTHTTMPVYAQLVIGPAGSGKVRERERGEG
jgi:hypothetical protein